jgi:hypothetical protein
VLTCGADALAALGDSAASAGLILSQEALGHLNEFQDSLDLLKANASASGNILAGVFSGALKESTDIIGQAIPSITGMVAGMFSGDNGAAAQGELSNSLIDIANQLIGNLATQIPQFLAGFNAVIISLVTALTTILPTAINTLLPTILTGFTNLILGLIPQIPILLPIIINAGLQLFTGLLDALNQIIPPLLAMLPGLIDSVGAMLIENLPVIINAGFQLLISPFRSDNTDLQILRQTADGGQSFPLLNLFIDDCQLYLVDNLLIDGQSTVG